MNYLLITKTETGFRTIVYEIYDGLKSIVDMIESPAPWCWADGNKFVCNEGVIDVALDPSHTSVDFGRAKKLGSKIKKICEVL